MKSKSFVLMIVSLGFGLIAAIGISQVMGRGNGPAAPSVELAPVLVSLDHLDHNALLSDENVKIEHWPTEIIPEAAARSLDEIENKAITTRLSKGLPILLTDIVDKNDVGKLPIPPGFKVVAIKVAEDDTIDGLLAPGDKVDVIGVFKFRDKDTGHIKSTSKTFLKKITVFSVNANTRTEGPREALGGKKDSIVGVLVNEKQSEQIVLVEKEAQLKLVLRGDDGDEAAADDSMSDFANMFGGSEQKTKNEGKSVSDYLRGMMSGKNDSNHTMNVWNGQEVVSYTFTPYSSLPQSSNPQPAPQTDGSSSDGEGGDDYNRSNEIDRGLEEDQYPGE